MVKREAATVKLGVYLRLSRTNSRGRVHGGFICAMADNAMGLTLAAAIAKEGRPATSLVTTSLNVDFVGPAEPGQWLEVNPLVVHVGGIQGLVQSLVLADGKVIARATATFRFRNQNNNGEA